MQCYRCRRWCDFARFAPPCAGTNSVERSNLQSLPEKRCNPKLQTHNNRFARRGTVLWRVLLCMIQHLRKSQKFNKPRGTCPQNAERIPQRHRRHVCIAVKKKKKNKQV
jgi:hypothetical protein